MEEGITVPYGPIFDGMRHNRGFVDTRNDPVKASQIAEGAESTALLDCLVRIARENVYFSLGCDLGSHEDISASAATRFVAGGYLQITGVDYAAVSTDMLDALCTALENALRPHSKSQTWRIEFVGKYVRFRLANESAVMAPSIWMWFFAAARNHKKAQASRESLISSIEIAMHSSCVVQKFREAS
jgi:hypothetical protein